MHTLRSRQNGHPCDQRDAKRHTVENVYLQQVLNGTIGIPEQPQLNAKCVSKNCQISGAAQRCVKSFPPGSALSLTTIHAKGKCHPGEKQKDGRSDTAYELGDDPRTALMQIRSGERVKYMTLQHDRCCNAA